MSTSAIEARQHIDQQRAVESLQGDDEDTTQFRNIVTAAKNVVDKLGERRAALAETDQYTPKGLVAALQDEAKIAANNLANLRNNNLQPRLTRLENELASLGPPQVGDELDPMERNRLIAAYLDAPADKRNELRAKALTNRKLATALSEEDHAVTNLTPAFIGQLRDSITSDPNEDKRAELQRKLNAARAAEAAIRGAGESVRKATELD